jgi:hypothetical protein
MLVLGLNTGVNLGKKELRVTDLQLLNEKTGKTPFFLRLNPWQQF